MPALPNIGESPTTADARMPTVPDAVRQDDSRLWEAEDEFASARMLGTAMLIAIAGYTAVGIGLWGRGKKRRR